MHSKGCLLLRWESSRALLFQVMGWVVTVAMMLSIVLCVIQSILHTMGFFSFERDALRTGRTCNFLQSVAKSALVLKLALVDPYNAPVAQV